MKIVEEILKIISELYPKLHSYGIDLLCIAVTTVLMEILKRVWFKKIVYKSIKYHKKRMRAMFLMLAIESIIISAAWNFKYYSTARLYQIIISTMTGSFALYEALRLIGVKRLLDKWFGKNEN
jgi:hypothetical protein